MSVASLNGFDGINENSMHSSRSIWENAGKRARVVSVELFSVFFFNPSCLPSDRVIQSMEHKS